MPVANGEAAMLEAGMRIRDARPEDAEAIARVHVESWQTTYRGIVPDDVLANLSVEQRAQFWARTLSQRDAAACTCVAEDDTGAVVGFASGGPEREHDPVYTGELYAIYLLAAHQGSGTGRRLARRVTTRLAGMSHHALLVWVLAENPACGFYASLGGVPVGEKRITIGGASLVEIAYGWRDTRSLIEPSEQTP